MDHEGYAAALLKALQTETTDIRFEPDSRKSRNAAKALATILCARLAANTSDSPRRISGTTYEWNEGVFNNRNITDRQILWTNIRNKMASEMHTIAVSKPAVYLLACSAPRSDSVLVWAIPEPLLFQSMQFIPVNKDGQARTLEIHNQRIKNTPNCPDLSTYFFEFRLSGMGLELMNASRQFDAMAKRDPQRKLTKVAKKLAIKGIFDPRGIKDARARVFRSITLRQGQPEFRKELITNYRGKCAISGCDVKAVLEAAHISPYQGTETNHPSNGILLRADLHTLFDLKLISIDPHAMTVLVSPTLSGTCYEALNGQPIRVPKVFEKRPSTEALRSHRENLLS